MAADALVVNRATCWAHPIWTIEATQGRALAATLAQC